MLAITGGAGGGSITIHGSNKGEIPWPTGEFSLSTVIESLGEGDGGSITVELRVQAIALSSGTAIINYDHSDIVITVQETMP